MEKFDTLKGIAAPLPIVNVDTDMIIPKQFLKTIKRTGLGKNLFDEMRYDDAGKEIPTFVLNRQPYRHAKVLVGGDNFGCGSSREHAPQSLYRAGFRAIIAGNFAEIFFGNSINLGIPCVSVTDEERVRLAGIIDSNPSGDIKINLIDYKIHASNQEFAFELRKGARDSLINGKWDPIDELLSKSPEIEKVANSLLYS